MKTKDYLFRITVITFCAWIIAQVVTLCYYRDAPQFSDAAMYDEYARQCYAHKTLYPDATQVYTNYIFNPGYVNWLLLHFLVFGSLSFVNVCNILLNVLIVWEIFLLAKYFFDRQTALISVILYCLLPSNTLIVQTHLTELPFMAAVLGAVCSVRRDKYLLLALAGILLAAANWIRPVALLFLLPVVIYMFMHKFHARNYLSLLLPLFAATLLIGVCSKSSSGYFVYQSSSGGFNLVQGANDHADGGYGKECFKEGNLGYIEDMAHRTFAERDSIWKARSVEWIKKNPVGYISLIPVKFARMWWGDDYLGGFLKGNPSFMSTNPSAVQKIQRVLSGFLFSLTYYVVMLCFMTALFKLRKKRNRDMYLLLLPIVLCTVMQVLIYGSQRYHYPCIPFVIFFAAWWISSLRTKKAIPSR
ncbi:MAG: glycosyltransferase family 39 protein [Tannerella sp.]|nr:glycosyltransferase family 39 protein [Tannerella sp.]